MVSSFVIIVPVNPGLHFLGSSLSLPSLQDTLSLGLEEDLATCAFPYLTVVVVHYGQPLPTSSPNQKMQLKKIFFLCDLHHHHSPAEPCCLQS